MATTISVHPVAFSKDGTFKKIHAMMIITHPQPLTLDNIVVNDVVVSTAPFPVSFKCVSQKSVLKPNDKVPNEYRLSVVYEVVFGIPGNLAITGGNLTILGSGAATISDLSFSIVIGGQLTVPPTPVNQVVPIIEIDPCIP